MISPHQQAFRHFGTDVNIFRVALIFHTLNRFSTHILEDIETCVVEGLVTTDESMTIVPLLAASVPTVENGDVVLRKDGGMDVTWRLRPGVTWHDGTPHTSADVKFTVEAINSPAYNPESTDGFDRISSVDTPDPLTAVVHYREVYAPYALQFVRGTLPKHRLEGRDIDSANDYNRAPLGTGPYRVAEWKSGEHIRLEAVPNYWRGAPAISSRMRFWSRAVSWKRPPTRASSSSRMRIFSSIRSSVPPRVRRGPGPARPPPRR